MTQELPSKDFYSCSIGGRAGEPAGQGNTSTPYIAICITEVIDEQICSQGAWNNHRSALTIIENCSPDYNSRPMTLHSPTENCLAVLNPKILEANSQVQNVKLGGHQTCLSINRLWHELCDMLRRLVGTTAPGHHDCSIQE
ncbi:uncharacterized protein TNCV_976951 [Trichonephila clavipes]|nr:uncharacterized protein TNCV_976951 [Trichonephila clavipes]